MLPNSRIVDVASPEDTSQLAGEISSSLPWGGAVGLTGTLGAGKTFFVRSLVESLGGKREQVASPSYTLQYEYPLPDGRIVEHWDLYRLTVLPEELLEPVAPTSIRIIEWWEKFLELKPAVDLVLSFELLFSDTARRITILRGNKT